MKQRISKVQKEDKTISDDQEDIKKSHLEHMKRLYNKNLGYSYSNGHLICD